jgi:hypothetical protein
VAVPREDLEDSTIELVHPVYLDVPMLVSFVAAAEGGYAFESEETGKESTGTEKAHAATARGRVGFPLLSALVGLDMSGRYGREAREEESKETKVVRQHTEASLFNLLRHQLHETERITAIGDQERLTELKLGELVEVSGEVLGNPLQQVLDLFAQILPYLGVDVEALSKPKKRKDPSRSGHPGKAAGTTSSNEDLTDEDAFRLMTTMRGDLERASIRDLVVLGPDRVRAVLTLSTEFFSDQTADYLLGGRFTVVGKVTRVLAEGETINLTRRTALGLGGPDLARQIVTDVTSDNELFVDLGDPVVEPPAVQLLPLAVFV